MFIIVNLEWLFMIVLCSWLIWKLLLRMSMCSGLVMGFFFVCVV